jgi:hypothetical protein
MRGIEDGFSRARVIDKTGSTRNFPDWNVGSSLCVTFLWICKISGSVIRSTAFAIPPKPWVESGAG